MRFLRRLFIVVGAAVFSSLIFGMKVIGSVQITDLKYSIYENPTLKVIAHRGSSSSKLEHTFEAYQQAIDEGCRQIELDVYQSKDGTLYVSHDPNTLRLTGQNYVINETTDEILSSLRVHNGENFHTLQEFFNHFGDSILYLVELKEGTPALENLQTCIEKNPKLRNHIMVQTWDVQSLNALESRYPDMFKQLLLNENDDIASYVKCSWIDSFAVRSAKVTKEDIDLAHTYKKQFWVWTVNEDKEVEKYKAWNVDGVITDRPGYALKIMEA